MIRIPRNQVTGLEILMTLIGLGIYIALIPASLAVIPPKDVNTYGGLLAPVDFSLTYLVTTLFMPTWGVVGLENFRLRRQAERLAGWWATRHPLREQKMECLVRAAYLAWNRGDDVAASGYAASGVGVAGEGLDRPAVSFYYALCLEVRAWALQKEGRYQEALEQYGQAVRLHLKPPSLTAQYYAHAAGLLYILGRFDEALLFAEQAIAGLGHSPDAFTTEAHRWAALSLVELARYDEALLHCEKGMVRQPFNLFSILLMADYPWLLCMAGQDEDVEASFAELKQTALEGVLAKHLHQEYHEVLGRVRLSQGQWEEAESLFSASLTDVPRQHLSALYHLCLIARHGDDETQAGNYRDRLLREAPESFYAARLCRGQL